MKNILILILIISLPLVSAALTKINVDYHNQESLFIYKDKVFTVPSCRKVLLQDINQLGESKWLEIEGVVQISEDFNFQSSPSHYLNGKFTYSTDSGLPKQKIIVYPESTIILRSNFEEARAPIELFSWIGEGDCRK